MTNKAAKDVSEKLNKRLTDNKNKYVCDTCENPVEDDDSVHHQLSFKQVCVTRQPLPPPFPTITQT